MYMCMCNQMGHKNNKRRGEERREGVKDPPRQPKLSLHPTCPPSNATDDENESCGGAGTNSSANLSHLILLVIGDCWLVVGKAPAPSAAYNARANTAPQGPIKEACTRDGWPSAVATNKPNLTKPN